MSQLTNGKKQIFELARIIFRVNFIFLLHYENRFLKFKVLFELSLY